MAHEKFLVFFNVVFVDFSKLFGSSYRFLLELLQLPTSRETKLSSTYNM